ARLELADAVHGGARRGDRRGAGDVELNRPLADLRLVELAPATARRVDHELHLAAFHAVEDVRRALSDLSDRGDVREAARLEILRRPGRRDDLEAELLEILADRRHVLLVAIDDGDEDLALERQVLARG